MIHVRESVLPGGAKRIPCDDPQPGCLAAGDLLPSRLLLDDPGSEEGKAGYFAEKDHEGQGYASEAPRGALQFCFENLQAAHVRLETDDSNLRSIGVAERCGMNREGHLRGIKKNADGSISGTVLYGLLRSENEDRKAEARKKAAGNPDSVQKPSQRMVAN